MSPANPGQIGTIAAVALILGLAGYLIKYRGRYALIAGFDARRVKTPERLGRWVGGGLLLLAGACCTAAMLLYLLPDEGVVVVSTLAAVLVVAAFVIATGGPSHAR